MESFEFSRFALEHHVLVWTLLWMVEVEVRILLFLKVEVEALGSPLQCYLNREKKYEQKQMTQL